MSPRSSNTIPTVITDKNGKITTVHKKTDPKVGTGSNIPAPSASKGKSAAKSKGKAIHIPDPVPDPTVVIGADGIPRHSVSGEDLRLDKNDPDSPVRTARNMANGEILFSLLEQFNGGRKAGTDKMVFAVRADNAQLRVLIEGYKKEGFGELLNAATASGLSDRDRLGAGDMASIALLYDESYFSENPFPDSVKPTSARMAGHKLRQYKSMLSMSNQMSKTMGFDKRVVRDLANQPQEVVDKFVAFSRLYKSITEVDPSVMFTQVKPLTELAFSDGIDPDDVTAIIREQGTIDPNQVAGMLEGVSPSVSDGWL